MEWVVKLLLDYLSAAICLEVPSQPSSHPPSHRRRHHLPDHPAAWFRADSAALYNRLEESPDEQTAHDILEELNSGITAEGAEECTPSNDNDSQYPYVEQRTRIYRENREQPDNLRAKKRKVDFVPAELQVVEQWAERDNPKKRRKAYNAAGSNVEGAPDQAEYSYHSEVKGKHEEYEHEIITLKNKSICLYRELQSHWSCACEQCRGICLQLPWPYPDSDDVQLDGYFALGSNKIENWQEGKFFMTYQKHGLVRIADESDNTAGEYWSALDHTDICPSIKDCHKKSASLHIMVEDNKLQQLRMGDNMCEHTAAAISLKSIFDFKQKIGGSSVFSRRGKLTLALYLTEMLRPVLETPWLLPNFSCHDVYFFRRPGALPDLTYPFIFTSANTFIQDTASQGASKETVHPNQTVLALGILLLEIFEFKPFADENHGSSRKRSLDQEKIQARRTLRAMTNEEGADFCDAVSACLDAKYFPRGLESEFDTPAVQDSFSAKVVSRLYNSTNNWINGKKDLLSLRENETEKRALWTIEAQNKCTEIGSHISSSPSAKAAVASTYQPPADTLMKPTARSAAVPLRTTNYSQNKEAVIVHRNYNCSPIAQAPVSEGGLFDFLEHPASELSSVSWLKELDRTLSTYVGNPPQSSSGALIRIAILDTGFTPDNDNPEPRLKATRNFLLDTDDPQLMHDKVGHGTHTLGLLLRTAIGADIFVAKVSDTRTIGRDGYEPIIKAIRYATERWEVDIITMSFGIREFHDSLSKALSFAHNRNVLLFAAASNGGPLTNRAFPASEHLAVFGIHSMDGQGSLSKFNPKPVKTAFNLVALGEAVPSDWPKGIDGHKEDFRSLSGTSIATPIAAGFVASLLEYVRQQEAGLPQDSSIMGWLKRSQAIQAILVRFATDKVDGYHRLHPKKLFNDPDTKESIYDQIKKFKKYDYLHEI
ncbi:hypothetical protein MauCBS54593_001824 [Microsporum audouinii]